MEQRGFPSDLAWVRVVNPNKVYDVLVEHAGADNGESSRNTFVSCWENDGWHEWYFGGNLSYGKIWREMRHIPGEGYVPHLRVNCAREHHDDAAEAIIKVTERELLNILISVELRAAR